MEYTLHQEENKLTSNLIVVDAAGNTETHTIISYDSAY